MTDKRAVGALRAAATTIIEKRSNANQGDRARFFDAMPPVDFIEGPDWSLDEHGFAEWVVALLATLDADTGEGRDWKALLAAVLTGAEYDRMEAEGNAAAALGLTWNENQDRWET